MPDLTHLKWAYDIRKDILWRKHSVMYLYPPPEGFGEKLGDVVRKGVDAKFKAVAGRHLEAYMTKGAKPPAAIAATIQNFADDLAMGRDLTVRGGDYIAIQGYIQGGGK